MSSSDIQFMVDLFSSLKPQVYMEVGAKDLKRFHEFHKKLPRNGLAIATEKDLMPEWAEYRTVGADQFLCPMSFWSHMEDPEQSRFFNWCLDGRKIDALLIDSGELKDLEKYKPHVRKGGYIFIRSLEVNGFQKIPNSDFAFIKVE